MFQGGRTGFRAVRFKEAIMEEESGITFGEILHLIKKRVWWILGISVIVAIIAAVSYTHLTLPTIA